MICKKNLHLIFVCARVINKNIVYLVRVGESPLLVVVWKEGDEDDKTGRI